MKKIHSDFNDFITDTKYQEEKTHVQEDFQVNDFKLNFIQKELLLTMLVRLNYNCCRFGLVRFVALSFVFCYKRAN